MSETGVLRSRLIQLALRQRIAYEAYQTNVSNVNLAQLIRRSGTNIMLRGELVLCAKAIEDVVNIHKDEDKIAEGIEQLIESYSKILLKGTSGVSSTDPIENTYQLCKMHALGEIREQLVIELGLQRRTHQSGK